jgi:hypothetical protein
MIDDVGRALAGYWRWMCFDIVGSLWFGVWTHAFDRTGDLSPMQRNTSHVQVSISLYAAVCPFSPSRHQHRITENQFVFTTYWMSG